MKKQSKAAPPVVDSQLSHDRNHIAAFETDSATVHVYRYENGKQALRLHFRSGPDRLFEDFFHHCVVTESDLFAVLLGMVQLLGASRLEEMAAAATGDPLNFQDYGVKAVHVQPERRAAPRGKGARLVRRPKRPVLARNGKGVARG